MILEALKEVVLFNQEDSSGLDDVNHQTNTYFLQACLEIISSLLDNIQKSQLVESEEVYYELLTTFLSKGNSQDIYELTGLARNSPYADGLEPHGQ